MTITLTIPISKLFNIKDTYQRRTFHNVTKIELTDEKVIIEHSDQPDRDLPNSPGIEIAITKVGRK